MSSVTMLGYKKDSTISSKISEYDNVPVLPSDYHGNHLNHHHHHLHNYQDDVEPPPLLHYHAPHDHDLATFPLEDPPPVPPHQVPLTIPNTAAITTTTTLGNHSNHNNHYEGREESPEPPKGPLQFPTENDHLGYDPLEGQQQQQQQQQAQQEEYESLDHRLVLQHQKQQQQNRQRQHEGIGQQEVPVRSPAATATSTISSGGKTTRLYHRGRSHRESYGGEMSTASSMVFYCLVFLAEILMFGLLSLVLFWTVYYRGGFAWREDVKKEFNYHPVLMVTGFIFFMGHGMLVYRLFRCCNKLTAKILHTFLHLLAVPCIVVGTITVFDSHNLRTPPIPNLYSLHSWLGVVTIGLFALQLVVGFFSFWLLICCEQATAKFRAGLVPVHATFGIITFMLAIATAVTGYTEKAFFSLKTEYSQFVDETWVINSQAGCLAGLAILMGILLYSSRYARTTHPVAIVDTPSSSHYVMTQKTYYYRDHE